MCCIATDQQTIQSQIYIVRIRFWSSFFPFLKCDKYTRRNVQAQLRSICHWFIVFPHTHHQIHFPFLFSSAHSICSWIVVRSNYMRYLMVFIILLLNNIKVICMCVGARSLLLCVCMCVYWLNGDLALRSTKWPHYRDLTCSYQSNERNEPLFSRWLWLEATEGERATRGRRSSRKQWRECQKMNNSLRLNFTISVVYATGIINIPFSRV